MTSPSTPKDATAARDLVDAARRAAVSMAGDPALKHYSPDTMAVVLEATINGIAGAGNLATAASRIIDDPTLAGVPFEVQEPLVAASLRHFVRALTERRSTPQGESYQSPSTSGACRNV